MRFCFFQTDISSVFCIRLAVRFLVALLFCLTFGTICIIKELDANFFFIPTMLICIVAYFYNVNLDHLKLLYLFLCAIALLSFGGLANDITEAKLNPYHCRFCFISIFSVVPDSVLLCRKGVYGEISCRRNRPDVSTADRTI